MGVIISRFRRKKTTGEVLEKLENNIRSIEQRGKWTQMQHLRVISRMTACSVGIYVLFAIVYYLVYFKTVSWMQSILYATPLLLLPILVLMMRNVTSWYYNRKLSRDRLRLNKMRDEKKKILEEVMNTETYKVAKEILDKYGDPDDKSKALRPFVPNTNVPGNPHTPTSATPGQLRQRQLMATPNNKLVVGEVSMRSPLRPEQLPHPLVPNEQTVLDRVINFFLNDGADKRFALICSNCYSHNGMVFEEMFDYTSYRCAYCGKLNASRKQRPRAPLLDMSRPSIQCAPNRTIEEAPSSSSESEEEEIHSNKGIESSAAVPAVSTPKPAEDKKND